MTEIENKYIDEGGETGILGAPVSEEQQVEDGVGRFRFYNGGSIYWHPVHGAHFITSRLRGRYSGSGYTRFVGYPIEDERPIRPDDIERYGLASDHAAENEGVIIMLEYACIVKFNVGNGTNTFKSGLQSSIGPVTVLEDGKAELYYNKGAFGIVEKRMRAFLSEMKRGGESIQESELITYNRSFESRASSGPQLIVEVLETNDNTVVASYHPGFDKINQSYVGSARMEQQSSANHVLQKVYGRHDSLIVKTSEQIAHNAKVLLTVSFRISNDARKSLAYKKNVDEYRIVMQRKSQILDDFSNFDKRKINNIPISLDQDIVTIIKWQYEFQAWFEKNGYKVPEVRLKNAPSIRTIWEKGIKLAAFACIEMQQKEPNLSQVKICEKFLSEWEISGEPDYSPHKLSNMISKIKYEGIE